MKKMRLVVILAIVLIGGIVLTTLWSNLRGRKASEEREGPPRISTDGANSRMERIRFVEDKHGKRTWELEAKSVQQYQDQNVIVIEDVKLTFYANDGRSIIVSGSRGKIYQDSKNMELTGHVTLISSDGYELRTDSVAYHHEDKKVTSSDPVEIDGEEIHLKGKGMLVDIEARMFKVLGGVRTQWKERRKG